MLTFQSAMWRLLGWCDYWHWALLILVAPFLLFPSPARSPFLLIVPGLWIIASLVGRDPLPRTPLNVTLLLMIIMVLVSILVTFDMAFSLPKLAGLVLGVGVFYAFVRYSNSFKGWWLCLVIFLGVGLVIAAFGLISTRWLEKVSLLSFITSRLPPRIIGLPGTEEGLQPNQLAGGLVWVLPMFASLTWLAFSQKQNLSASWGRRIGITMMTTFTLLTLFAGFVLFLTQSRSAYIGFAVSTIIVILFLVPIRWRWFYIGSLVVAALIVAIGIRQFETDAMFASAGTQLVGGGAFSVDTLEGRVELWSRAIYAIQDFPFTGTGLNTFRRIVPVIYPLFLIGPDFDFGNAHNEYLQVALDLGLPGLIAFLGIYIGSFWMLREIWNIVRGSPGESQLDDNTLMAARWSARAVVLGLAAGLLAHMVFGLTDATSPGAKPGILLWMLLGLITGLFNQAKSGRLIELPFWYRSRVVELGPKLLAPHD